MGKHDMLYLLHQFYSYPASYDPIRLISVASIQQIKSSDLGSFRFTAVKNQYGTRVRRGIDIALSF